MRTRRIKGRGHRKQCRTRWRRLEPGRQALLALAQLRNGDTYTRLAAGFEIGVATAWRYVQEAIALLSSAADDLDTAMRRIRLLAYAILDGTLIPTDRVAKQKPYYSGKHKRHSVTCRSSPMPLAGSSGLHRRCPVRSIT